MWFNRTVEIRHLIPFTFSSAIQRSFLDSLIARVIFANPSSKLFKTSVKKLSTHLIVM